MNKGTSGEGYWYADAEDIRASSVMEALRGYRAAEVAMRRRTRQSMDMGENELLVLRYLMRARKTGEPVTPANLARYLGITSASTTALLDRLERAGTLQRVSNPTDRRSVLITPTPSAAATLSATVDEYERRVTQLAEDLDDASRRTIIDFLESVADVAEEVAVG